MSPSTRTRSAEGVKSFDLLIVRELATTRYRRSSSARVMPNPMPLDAPVTMATGRSLVFALIAFFPFGLVRYFGSFDQLRFFALSSLATTGYLAAAACSSFSFTVLHPQQGGSGAHARNGRDPA